MSTTTTAPAVAAGTKVHIGHEVDGELVGTQCNTAKLPATAAVTTDDATCARCIERAAKRGVIVRKPAPAKVQRTPRAEVPMSDRLAKITRTAYDRERFAKGLGHQDRYPYTRKLSDARCQAVKAGATKDEVLEAEVAGIRQAQADEAGVLARTK